MQTLRKTNLLMDRRPTGRERRIKRMFGYCTRYVILVCSLVDAYTLGVVLSTPSCSPLMWFLTRSAQAPARLLSMGVASSVSRIRTPKMWSLSAASLELSRFVRNCRRYHPSITLRFPCSKRRGSPPFQPFKVTRVLKAELCESKAHKSRRE